MAQPNVNGSKLAKIKIPLPPVGEQEKIVAHLDSLSGKIKKLQEYQKSTALDFISLEQSILSHSIGSTGSLQVNSGQAKSFQ
ncbi:restriction endonuclease subunit S [Candidatus Wolfebacteria bacterium]|nr:restriction endonuclease subunit S [Candidatus Wolfebacteria bacterium]